MRNFSFSVLLFPHAGPDMKYFLGFLRTQMSTTTTIILVLGTKVSTTKNKGKWQSPEIKEYTHRHRYLVCLAFRFHKGSSQLTEGYLNLVLIGPYGILHCYLNCDLSRL